MNRALQPSAWRTTSARLPIVALMIGSLVLAAAVSRQLPAEESPLRQVIVTDREFHTAEGLLEGLRDGRLFMQKAKSEKLETRNLVSLRWKDRVAALAPTDPLVLLANGDVLVVRLETADEESLTGRWARYPVWPRLNIPLETVRAIVLQAPTEPMARSRLLNRLYGHREPRDRIILTNGDSLFGKFSGLDDKTLSVETAAGTTAVERGGIRAVALNSDLAHLAPMKSEGVLVALTDGSHFHASAPAVDAIDRLSAKSQFGAELQMPLSAVESLRFLGGCCRWISELEPAEYRFEPFFELKRPLVRDRNVLGGFLRLRGIEYPLGLGMHSKSEVTYRLDGQFKRFSTTIGIDDDAAGRGAADFEVLLDGKTVFKSETLGGASAAVVVGPIDVSRGRQLTLRVNFGPDADIGDHADWCDAVLVR